MKTTSTIIAAAVIALTAQSANAGSFGAKTGLSNVEANSAIISVHSKMCKFTDAHGYVYKDHCPHGLRKGSRGKRAGIGAGVGAATGAALGAIFGGGRGAAIGALVGAGAGALGGASSVRKCWYRDNSGRKVRVKCRQ